MRHKVNETASLKRVENPISDKISISSNIKKPSAAFNTSVNEEQGEDPEDMDILRLEKLLGFGKGKNDSLIYKVNIKKIFMVRNSKKEWSEEVE